MLYILNLIPYICYKTFLSPSFFKFVNFFEGWNSTVTLFTKLDRWTEYIVTELFHSHTHIRLAPVGLDHIFNPLQVCVGSHREAHGVKPLFTPHWIYQKHWHLIFQPSQLAFLLLFIPASPREQLWHLQQLDLWGQNQVTWISIRPLLAFWGRCSSLCQFPLAFSVWERKEWQTERGVR